MADPNQIPEALPVVRTTRSSHDAPEPWNFFFLAIFNSGRCSMPQNDPANNLKWEPKENSSFSHPNQLDLARKNGTKSTFWPLRRPSLSLKIVSITNNFTSTKLLSIWNTTTFHIIDRALISLPNWQYFHRKTGLNWPNCNWDTQNASFE